MEAFEGLFTLHMTREEILSWLLEGDEKRLDLLWDAADSKRADYVGEEVHLRGLIEISNHCSRLCAYCGIRAENDAITRYRMTEPEIMECVYLAQEFGYGTVVIQSGEDFGIGRQWFSGIIRKIKSNTALAVTLSLGERSIEDLKAWKEAGADRYLLRFETSDQSLFRCIHPPRSTEALNRIEMLHMLRELGYEIGGGIMVGIPGQTYDSVARDIELFRSLDLDMIGIGPYLPHPSTPLGSAIGNSNMELLLNQVPNTELMTCKVLALARIVCPEANLPSTTALGVIDPKGRKNGLQRGANVIMPNLTPLKYRRLYDIYPKKTEDADNPPEMDRKIKDLICRIKRRVGKGYGSRKRRC